MSDLVKRLRRAKGSELLPKILLGHKNAEIACLEAADRIEQLEAQQKLDRENINLKADVIECWIDTSAEQDLRIEELEQELAAEKALADRAYALLPHAIETDNEFWTQWDQMASEALEAYRKARGL